MSDAEPIEVRAKILPSFKDVIEKKATDDNTDPTELMGRFMQIGVQAWRSDKKRWDDLVHEPKTKRRKHD